MGWTGEKACIEHAARVVQLPGVVFLCDLVAPTYRQTGKLEAPVLVLFLRNHTSLVFSAKPCFGPHWHSHLPIGHLESLYHLPLCKTSPAAPMVATAAEG